MGTPDRNAPWCGEVEDWPYVPPRKHRASLLGVIVAAAVISVIGAVAVGILVWATRSIL